MDRSVQIIAVLEVGNDGRSKGSFTLFSFSFSVLLRLQFVVGAASLPIKTLQKTQNIIFKNGPTPASFCLFLIFSNKQYNFYNTSM